jgi:DNA-binding transcriptional MerR regulator
MEEHLSPTETARRLSTTVKALKVYERLGLVRPMRTAAGWRLYGPAQIMRLHEVLALKALGLSLAQIGAALAGRPTDLSLTLAVQETALRERRREIDRVLGHVRRVRERLAAGEVLSTAELIAAARDTTAPPPSWQERMLGYYRRHLGEAALARLKPGDPQVWAGLIAELKALRETDVAPQTPGAQDFFRRWVIASHAVSGGDPQIGRRAHAAWIEALEDDPSGSSALPLAKADIDYLARLSAGGHGEQIR